MGLFLVYIFGSWLLMLVKVVGMIVSQVVIMMVIYQVGGIFGLLFVGWLMDRINFYCVLGIIYVVGGLFIMVMGYVVGSFVLFCMLVFISGVCLNGVNIGMNVFFVCYYFI